VQARLGAAGNIGDNSLRGPRPWTMQCYPIRLVKELRATRWDRQVIVASHNANVPVNGDAESVVALENADGALRVRDGCSRRPRER